MRISWSWLLCHSGINMNNNPRAILVPIGINLHRWFSVVYVEFHELGVVTRGLFFAMRFKVSDWRRLEFPRLQLH